MKKPGRQHLMVCTPNRAITMVAPEKMISRDFGKMLNSCQKDVWINESYEMIKQYM